MKVEIYYYQDIGVPTLPKEKDGELPRSQSLSKDFETIGRLDVSGDCHQLVWKGNLEDLGIAVSELKIMLENIWYKFQDSSPKGFAGGRVSMSIGDIVVLDGDAYVCRTADWMKIEFPGN